MDFPNPTAFDTLQSVRITPDPPVDPKWQLPPADPGALTGCGTTPEGAARCAAVVISLLMKGKAQAIKTDVDKGLIEERWNQLMEVAKFRRVWNETANEYPLDGAGNMCQRAVIRLEFDYTFVEAIMMFGKDNSLLSFEFGSGSNYKRDEKLEPQLTDLQRDGMLFVASILREDEAAMKKMLPDNGFLSGYMPTQRQIRQKYGQPIRFYAADFSKAGSLDVISIIAIYPHGWTEYRVGFENHKCTFLDADNGTSRFPPLSGVPHLQEEYVFFSPKPQ